MCIRDSNISYLSSQENGTDYQLFKMGLFVEDPARIHAFLREARALCPVRVIDYDRAEKTFDNSIFYDSFVSGLCRAMDLPESARPSLLVNANLAMQTLDERGLSPYRTFDSIRRFAELLSQSRGERFLPRVTNCRLTDETALTLIEPPCGSNTAILTHGEDVLFIDSGYACYRPEMLTLFRRLVPNFDARKKTILITHADVDHCGLLPEFDEVLLSAKSAECLRLEAAGQDGYRERNPLHKPYIQICKCLTGYRPPDTDRLRVLWGGLTPLASPLEPIGRFAFGDLDFVRYVMAIDPEKKLNRYGKGKYLLRKAFEGDWLPPEILWREKAAFSDAVGHSMVDDIKEYAEGLYTEEEFQMRRANYSAHCMPFTKESLFYREIFEKYYHDQSRTIVGFWMPNKAWPGCNVNDPSARVLANYGASGV